MKLRMVVLALSLGVAMTACYTPIQVKEIGRVGTEWTDGVPFYMPTKIKRSFKLTKLQRNGVVIGVAKIHCEEVEGEEYLVTSDLSKLHMIRSHDFFFGQNTFGVTLEKGVLASVNSVRDPQVDETIGAIVDVAETVAAMGVTPPSDARIGPPEDVLPDCNTGKRYTDPLPEP
jgi:hypothetical protein